MFPVPAKGSVRSGACAEARVVPQPAARGEAGARFANDPLVAKELEGAGWVGRY